MAHRWGEPPYYLPEPIPPMPKEVLERAACRGRTDLIDVFFPKSTVGVSRDPELSARAMRFCNRCPVRKECDDYATRAGIKFGVWGGVDEPKRMPKKRASGARKPKPKEEDAA